MARELGEKKGPQIQVNILAGVFINRLKIKIFLTTQITWSQMNEEIVTDGDTHERGHDCKTAWTFWLGTVKL